MTYANIMVAVDPGADARSRVRLAGHLTDDFGSRLIGVAAERPDYAAVPIGPTPGGSYVLPRLHEACLDGLKRAHTLFDEAAAGFQRIEWRSDLDSPSHFMLQHAAGADLIVVGRPEDDPDTSPFYADPGDLVMQLGRPLLIVPPDVDRLDAARIAIGWKNTRAARRAIWDAMPFLKRASAVIVCTVDEGGEDLGEQVVRYLATRGIHAFTARTDARGASLGEALVDVACESAADLLVTGAYGHSRLQEWAFGGVTRDLLAGAPICCLMSH
ncbi:universal stress protein [Methylobacterium haplocladii]|uniref:UspA domain-containing protein n=1 Tax=Methylobacterium haplocladii TaxID=1176176 RepID=A0A512IPE2_9HYPH|nr:universal stress protein [Methylobacterium haplocladii]GEO99581.1 hypothetical protein MHA02_19690 [Methylobacterium haplocladii]GJD85872.1 hypothetical protein HPGCJGGD_3766 [Methylobacterium haplocladii]GLS58557.1 hypothetical protein GCM10007887_12210 [Methylobacterium haplocladii]